MKNGSDMKARLGKLPRKLATLYLDVYNSFFMHKYDIGQALITNAFKWILYMHKPLKSSQFIAAIAQNLSPTPTIISTDELLDLCCKFVDLNLTLDIFRFGHPSPPPFTPLLAHPAVTSKIFHTCAHGRNGRQIRYSCCFNGNAASLGVVYWRRDAVAKSDRHRYLLVSDVDLSTLAMENSKSKFVCGGLLKLPRLGNGQCTRGKHVRLWCAYKILYSRSNEK